jgi:energy-converting hydrogenase Eha subunit B
VILTKGVYHRVVSEVVPSTLEAPGAGGHLSLTDILSIIAEIDLAKATFVAGMPIDAKAIQALHDRLSRLLEAISRDHEKRT